jgi:hypothetical protein
MFKLNYYFENHGFAGMKEDEYDFLRVDSKVWQGNRFVNDL